MSYQVYDENGFVADFATTKGAEDTFSWMKSTDDVDLVELAETGAFIVPEVLLETLEVHDPPRGDVKDTVEDFKKALKKCTGIVIISDGINESSEE